VSLSNKGAYQYHILPLRAKVYKLRMTTGKVACYH